MSVRTDSHVSVGLRAPVAPLQPTTSPGARCLRRAAEEPSPSAPTLAGPITSGGASAVKPRRLLPCQAFPSSVRTWHGKGGRLSPRDLQLRGTSAHVRMPCSKGYEGIAAIRASPCGASTVTMLGRDWSASVRSHRRPSRWPPEVGARGCCAPCSAMPLRRGRLGAPREAHPAGP